MPPPFFLEDFLSGTDFGGYGLIRVQFWLGRGSVHRALSRKSRTIFRRKSNDSSDSISGLIMGLFWAVIIASRGVWSILSPIPCSSVTIPLTDTNTHALQSQDHACNR